MPLTNTRSAHVTARARGMKSRLMSHADLDALIDARAVQAVIDALVASPYDRAIAESLTRYTGVEAIEDATSHNLREDFGRLHAVFRPDPLCGRTDSLPVHHT